jgi:hypothetical protein
MFYPAANICGFGVVFTGVNRWYAFPRRSMGTRKNLIPNMLRHEVILVT